MDVRVNCSAQKTRLLELANVNIESANIVDQINNDFKKAPVLVFSQGFMLNSGSNGNTGILPTLYKAKFLNKI